MRTFLLLGCLAMGLLAFALYEPVPDYVQDRWLLVIQSAVLKTFTALASLFDSLHLGSFETLTQKASGLAILAPGNTSTVAFTYRQFASSRTLVAAPTSAAAASGAAIVYIHGGGWAFGAPELYSRVYTEIVEKTGATVFAIRYRLAPEHRFPTAFDDCLAATEAIFESAKSLGVDPSRIAIAGDSAGGQLTASVVQQLRRSGSQHKPRMHVVLYPRTQIVNVRTESQLKHFNAPIMKYFRGNRFISMYLTGSKAAAAWISRHGHVTDEVRAVFEKVTGTALPKVDLALASSDGVGDSDASLVSSVATDFRVSPLLGNDLEKLRLPPAHILACEFDPLLDDSVMYAKRLEMSGVRVLFRRFHTYHGAVVVPNDGRDIREYLLRIFRDEL